MADSQNPYSYLREDDPDSAPGDSGDADEPEPPATDLAFDD